MPKTKRGKLKVFEVRYSPHSSAKVKAYTVKGARERAWEMLGSYKYGWTRLSFLKSAPVTKVD